MDKYGNPAHKDRTDSTYQKDIPCLYFISSTNLVMSITLLLFRWGEEPMIRFLGKFPFQQNLSISYFTMFISLYSSIGRVH